MLIGILSDTHLRNPDQINNLLDIHFRDVDMIIHAGDFTGYSIYQKIKGYKAAFYGVCGNGDDARIQEELNEKEIILTSGVRIGLFHGHGQSGKTLERAYQAFNGDDIDMIIFGHSHQPLVTTVNHVVMINPGSITQKRREKRLSYALLEIQDGSFQIGLRFFQ